MPTPQEISSHIRRFIPKAQQDLQSKTTCQTREFDCLDLTLDLHSVDIYCYLKSKFGAANGITMMMRSGDTSDDLYHWQYTLVSGETFIDIHSTRMGVEAWFYDTKQSNQSEKDVFRQTIISCLRHNKKNIQKEKSRLENWNLFVNPYQRLNEVVANLESRVSAFDLKMPEMPPMTYSGGHWDQAASQVFQKGLKKYTSQISEAQLVGLSIKTTVPIWIEAFVNLLFFVLANEDTKKDKRVFDSFLRQQIDVRVKTLPNYCEGFRERIDGKDEEFKNFHRIFLARNDLLHGNINLKDLQVEQLYFDGDIPLYLEWKSEFARRLAPIIEFIEPATAREDIISGSEFIIYLVNKLEPEIADQIWMLTGAQLLGHRKDKNRLGLLFDGDVDTFIPIRGDVNPNIKFAAVEPKPTADCLCGSGSSFGRCCAGRYEMLTGEQYTELFRDKRFEDALTACRGHLTWYMLCHKLHTEKIVESDEELGETLMQIDVAAMGGIVEQLKHCYANSPQPDSFPNAIERIRLAISDKRFQFKIDSVLAKWWNSEKKDNETASKIMLNHDWRICHDNEAIAVYLNTCMHLISPSERASIATKIVELSENNSDSLHYSIVAATAFFETRQLDKCVSTLESAIERYRNGEQRDDFGEYQLANALQFLGKTKPEADSESKLAIVQYRKIMKDSGSDYTPEFHSILHRSIAQCFESCREFDAAIAQYEKSLEIEPTEICKVELSRSQCENGQIDIARDTIGKVDTAHLDPEGLFDFAISLAQIASESKLPLDVQAALACLREIAPESFYFQRIRDSAIISLLQFQVEALAAEPE